MADVKEEPVAKRTPGSLAELFHNWRYFFLFLALIFLVVLFYAEENWRGEWAWKKYQRQQATKGDRLNRTAFIPPPIGSNGKRSTCMASRSRITQTSEEF